MQLLLQAEWLNHRRDDAMNLKTAVSYHPSHRKSSSQAGVPASGAGENGQAEVGCGGADLKPWLLGSRCRRIRSQGQPQLQSEL